MNLPHEVIQNGLANPISSHRKWSQFHSSNGSHSRTDTYELAALLQQWETSLEKQKWSDTVNIHVLLDFGKRNCSHRCHSVGDACIGNDNIKRGDFVHGSEFFNGFLGVCSRAAVDFDNDEGAAFAFRKGCEGRSSRWITDGSDDGVVWAGEVCLCKAKAKAWDGVRDKYGRVGGTASTYLD